MNILITGANGFIGQHLLRELIAHSSSGLYCLTRSRDGLLPELQQWEAQRKITILEGDLRDSDTVMHAGQSMDIVIHLAASVSSNDMRANYDVNVQGAENLVKACREHHVQRIIFASSFAAMLSEKDNYGTTKAQAEEVFIRSELGVTMLRLAMVYGAGGKGFMKMVQNVTAIPGIIPLIGNGKYRRQPVYVGDVVSALRYCLEHPETKGKRYYLCGPEALQYREILSVIAGQMNVRKMMVPIPAFLWKAVGWILERLLKNPPMSKRDVTSMMADAVFGVGDLREFSIIPVTFEEGVKRSLG